MKQNQIYISIPVNAARGVLRKAKELCPDSQVFNSTKRYYADDLVYLDQIMQGKIDDLPDIMVSIRPEYQWKKEQILASDAFDSEYRYEVNADTQATQQFDNDWILKPVFIMPLVIFYNSEMKNPPQSWSDLLDDRFKGKIVTTDEATPPAALLKRFLAETQGERGVEVAENNIDYLGLPIDVNRAVSGKEYDIGIMPLSFAMFSKDNATKVCWPEEGGLYLTQVMLLKKGYSEDTKKIADYLISEEAQQMFSGGANFVPVTPAIDVPKLYIENNKHLLDLPKE